MFKTPSEAVRPPGTHGQQRRRVGIALALALASSVTAVNPFGPAPSVSAAPVGAVQEGGPVILDGTDSGLHGSIALDGSGVPKASELRSTWVYELKAWETLLAGVPSSYDHNGKVAIVGASASTTTSNNCGGAAHYVSQRLASGAVEIDYFEGAAAISTLFDDVFAGTANYQMIQIVEQGWCGNGMDGTEAAAVNARGPAIAAHVNRGGALFAQSQSYGWLNSLFPDLSASTACGGSTPELTAAGFAQFPGLTNSNIAAPWHNCFTASGEFPLTPLALQDGTHTVILGGDSVTLPSTVSLATTPEQPRPGDEVCTTATVVDSAGDPVEGASVEFFVDGESVGTELTDAAGEAVYCYTVATSGEDDVTATVETGPGTGTKSSTITTSTLSIDATPAATLARDASVCIDVVAATSDGSTETPTEGASISFVVDGPNGPASGSDVTDASGAAQYCYTGSDGGQDTVTATITSGAPSDSRSILVSWTGARVDVIDVEQGASQTGKVVPVTVAEFIAGTVYATVSVPVGEGTLSLNTSGYTVSMTAPTVSFSNQTTLAFEGSLADITGLLASRLTWDAPADAGTSVLTVTVADDPASPTETATGTGSLTVTSPPVITQQPESQTVNAGTMIMLHAHSSGYPTPVAQWQVSTDDGSTWTNVSGGEAGHFPLPITNEMDGYQYRARISNSTGNVISDIAVLTVIPAVAPVFTDSTIGDLQLGVAVTDGVSASGAPLPTYSVAAGSLPAGLELNTTTGAITGTPVVAGPYSFTIEASNAVSTASIVISGTVTSIPVFTDGTVASLKVGVQVSDGVAASGVPAPTYSVIEGALPAGLQLDATTGAITGTPTKAGDYSFTVKATNSVGSVTKVVSGTVDVEVIPPKTPVVPPKTTVEPPTSQDDKVTVKGSGFKPGSTVEIVVDDEVVGTTVADEDGNVIIEVEPPAGSKDYEVGLQGVAVDDTSVDQSDRVVKNFDGRSVVVPDDTGYMPMVPVRLLDTRDGERPAAGSTTRLAIDAAESGLPAGATEVAINVAAVKPGGLGFVTVFGCASERPEASAVNFDSGANSSNLAIVELDESGEICLYVSESAHLVVDLSGAFAPSQSDRLGSLAPTRLLDTRGGTRVGAGESVEVQVTGDGLAPDGAAAAVLNVAVVNPDDSGFLTLFPCDEEFPLASSLNYGKGTTRSNAAFAKLSESGSVCVFSSVATDLVIDLNGASASGNTSQLVANVPVRVLDTRSGDKVEAGETLRLDLGAKSGLKDVDSYALNVAAVQAEGTGYATIFPCGTERPLASSLNFTTGTPTPNHTTAKPGADGVVCIYVSATTHIVVDVEGVYL
jgi:hypothetical protein